MFVTRLVPKIETSFVWVEVESETEAHEEDEQGEESAVMKKPSSRPTEGESNVVEPIHETKDGTVSEADSFKTDFSDEFAEGGFGFPKRHDKKKPPPRKTRQTSVTTPYARFDPPLDTIAQIAVGALDRFVIAASGVPRVMAPAPDGTGEKNKTRDLSSKNGAAQKTDKKKSMLSAATLEDSPIAEARHCVHVVMRRGSIAPKGLAALFDPHLRLLTMDPEALALEFVAAERTLAEYRDVIDQFLEEATVIDNLTSNTVNCGAYSVDCSHMKRALSTAARGVATALLDSIRTSARDSNKHVVDACELIERTVGAPSATGEACVGLKNYMKLLPKEMDVLKAQILVNTQRDEFTHAYSHDMTDEDLTLSVAAFGWPSRVKRVLLKASVTVEKEYKVFEKQVKLRRKAFTDAIEARKGTIAEFKTVGDIVEREAIATKIDALTDAVATAQTESEEINAEERLFSFAPTKFGPVINAQLSALDPFKKLWQTTRSMFRNHRDWLTGPFSQLMPETMDEAVQDAYRVMFKLQKTFSGMTGGDRLTEPLKVANATLAKIEDFKTYQALIDAVCNPGLQQRHWVKMTDVIDVVGFTLQRDDHTSLKKLLDKGVLDHLEKIAECSDVASREWNFERALDKMIADWTEVRFILKDWKETGTCIFEGGPVDEAQVLLDEHIVKTQAMRASPFAAPFIDRVVPWEAQLTRLQDILDSWLRCQGKWLYLEPIFNSEEIMKQVRGFPNHHIKTRLFAHTRPAKGLLRPKGNIPSDCYPDCLLILWSTVYPSQSLIPIPHTHHDRLTLFFIGYQIPTEGAAFMTMDRSWRRLVGLIRDKPNAMDAPLIPDLLEDLRSANHDLDVVEKGLNDFLDTKKLAFPRFFFLSNDELLEILSEAKDPLKIQPFMKKCFEAVKEVEFSDDVTMRAMISVEGERVALSKEINPAETNAVELWMLEFEDVMKVSVREVTEKAIAEYGTVSREAWILNWPGQVILAASQVHWTKEVTDAIVEGGAKSLARYGETSNAQLTNIVNMVRGELSKLERATLASLVVIDVHARDVVLQMASDGVQDPKDFKWLAQLRYFWQDDNLVVRMINAEANYGYEYLGNSTRLVITPLTGTAVGLIQIQAHCLPIQD